MVVGGADPHKFELEAVQVFLYGRLNHRRCCLVGGDETEQIPKYTTRNAAAPTFSLLLRYPNPR